MNEIKTEILSVIDDNDDKRSPHDDQSDRFLRRLNKYRIHQSDCQVKNDESFREFCEQEGDHIKKLQEQKTINGKQRKPYKRKKNKVCYVKIYFEIRCASFFSF